MTNEELIAKLLRRASECCYWKEEYMRLARKADTVALKDAYLDSAERQESFENIWNEAVAIVKGERD